MGEINVVNSLAEITSYRDIDLVEQSPVKSIHELFPNTLQRLFSVKKNEDAIAIQLVAAIGDDGTRNYARNEDIEFSKSAQAEMISLNNMFEKVMASNSTKHLEIEERGMFYFICPVFNESNKTFSILLSSSTCAFSNKKEDICLGMLKVYSNYLNLLNNTQRDKLTGLFNRETLDEQILHVLHQTVPIKKKTIEVEIDSPKRRIDNHKETYLGIIDIDHFKHINDTYGHLYGDEILVLVARFMTNNFARTDDLVYRYGGEEFVILIKADDENNAKFSFERLRKNIQNYDFPQVGKVTVSIGFEHVTTQKSPQEVIAGADSALYFAKETGRNKTEYYQRLVSEGKLTATTSIMSEDVTLF